MERAMSVVLVTGGSGFVGSHTVIQLLAAGHSVRTTVRSTKREPDVRGMLAAAGCEPGDRLSFHVADLEKDDGWAEATAGCDYVHHIASPFPAGEPKHEDELIVPAREGALRALRAARDAKVKRVVLTSSFAAIGYGNDPGRPYTEEDWTDPADPRVLAYPRSKTIAERSAWDFIAREGEGLELAVVNPVGIFGPVLGADFATSILLLQRMLNGKIPGCPRLWFGAVDVRDVAGLHLLAMTHPEARGQRFLATAGDFLSVKEVADILRKGLGETAKKVPSREFPDWLVRVAAWFDPAVKATLAELGKPKNGRSDKARTLLGWAPRSPAEAILASAESLAQRGLLTP